MSTTRATRSGHTIVVGTYGNEHLARSAARSLRDQRPLTFSGNGSADLGDTAAHAAASRAAARAALVAIAVTATATVAAAMATGDRTLLALGLMLAVTGAPFAGGLAGFTWGLHRWSNHPVHIADPDRAAGRHAGFVAIRSAEPEAAALLLRT